MSEVPPLLFRKHLGGLYPANQEAEEAIAAIERNSLIQADIKQTKGNNKRMGLYWLVLGKAAEALTDVCEGDALNRKMLHQVLKDRGRLYTTTTLPSGEVLKNYESIRFAKMTENERSAYINWAFQTLAKWLGCSVDDLTKE